MPQRPLHIGIEARYLFAREKTGVERCLSQLVRYLGRIEELPPVTLYTNAPPEPVDVEAEEVLACPRLRVRVVPRRRLWLKLWIPLAARRDGVSVMHFPGGIPSLLRPYRTLVTIHDLCNVRLPELAYRNEAKLVRTIVRRGARSSDRVIAISECTARDVQELFAVPAERISVTPLAPDEQFRPVPDAARRVAQEFGLHGPYLLFVGTPYPRKNFGRILEALALLGPEAENVPLVVAGRKEWAAPGTRELAARLGVADRVRFLGDVADAALPALYSAAKMLVHPALYEGFGLTLTEAMACGTPVVTANVSSMPEVAGDAALLVDPHQPGEIAAAITRLLKEPRLWEQCSRRGRAQAARFSWERTARLTLEAYRAAHAARRGA
jgi:glycosyltransferase involved in cell wall biosynthesis